jgi:hypothetical protein
VGEGEAGRNWRRRNGGSARQNPQGLPWSDEIPAYVTATRLAEVFGGEVTPGEVAQTVALGLIEPDGEIFGDVRPWV